MTAKASKQPDVPDPRDAWVLWADDTYQLGEQSDDVETKKE